MRTLRHRPLSRARARVVVVVAIAVLVSAFAPQGSATVEGAVPARATKDVTLKMVGGTGAAPLSGRCLGVYDRVSTAAEIRNNTGKVVNHVKVVWQLFDSDGHEVTTTGIGAGLGVSESITIPPHGTGFAVPNDIELPVGASTPVRFRARIVAGSYKLQKHVIEKYDTGSFDVAKLELGFSSMAYTSKAGSTVFGTTFCPGGRLAGTVTNQSGVDIPPSSIPGANDRLHIKCALYSGNKIVGGFFTFIAALAAGASAPFGGGNGLVAGLTPSTIRCSGELGV